MTFNLEATIRDASLDLRAAQHAHAAVMQSISSVDPELGRRIHDEKRHKSFSVACIMPGRQRGVLRVTFLGREGLAAANVLMTCLSSTQSLQLGRVLWRITDVCVGGTEWTGISTWADLTSVSHGRHIYFDFATPTAFTKSNGWGERNLHILPTEVEVFGGLADRWKNLGGPPLPDNLNTYLLQRGCFIAEFTICSETWWLPERKQKGFVGRVTYECVDAYPVCLAALHWLARLAMYSGVGYQTARGMGAVMTRVGN